MTALPAPRTSPLLSFARTSAMLALVCTAVLDASDLGTPLGQIGGGVASGILLAALGRQLRIL